MKWNIHTRKYDNSWTQAEMAEHLFEWLIMHGDSEVEMRQLQGWMSEAIHFKYFNHRTKTEPIEDVAPSIRRARILHYIRLSIKGKRIATMRKVEYE